MNISEILNILACPKCHEQLEIYGKEDSPKGLLCKQCQVIYPIRDEIPIMLIDEAIPLNKFEANQI